MARGGRHGDDLGAWQVGRPYSFGHGDVAAIPRADVKLWTISLASTLNIGMGIVVFISVVIHCAASVFRIKPLIPQEFVA